jgi:hypothetical protein
MQESKYGPSPELNPNIRHHDQEVHELVNSISQINGLYLTNQ